MGPGEARPELLREFHQALKELGESRGSALRFRTPRAQHSYEFTIGHTGFVVDANATLEAISCELKISGHANKTLDAFRRLKERQAAIETPLGELDWLLRAPGGGAPEQESESACAIGITIDADIRDRSLWPELNEWRLERTEAFVATFKPLVRELDRERPAPEAAYVPVEQANVEGYDALTTEEVQHRRKAEAVLVDAYVDHLERAGDRVGSIRFPVSGGRFIWCDVFNESRSQLVEAKAGGSREEIRMAIGQLADYGQFVDPSPRPGVLLNAKPDPDLVDLLDQQGIAVIWRSREGFADNAGGAFT